MNKLVLSLTTVALAAVMSGCSAAPTGPVTASLKEFSITLGRATASPGSVTFNVTNAGTILHEFVVLDTDTAAGSLVVTADGTVSEDGLTVVDEIEDIAVGATPSLTVNLTAGHYAIICNVPGHYAGGMHTDFQVQ
jgi:uncharacterized cupredoxin-like copper-binding protein